MKIQLSHTFEEIISIENLLTAWKEFEKAALICYEIYQLLKLQIKKL